MIVTYVQSNPYAAYSRLSSDFSVDVPLNNEGDTCNWFPLEKTMKCWFGWVLLTWATDTKPVRILDWRHCFSIGSLVKDLVIPIKQLTMDAHIPTQWVNRQQERFLRRHFAMFTSSKYFPSLLVDTALSKTRATPHFLSIFAIHHSAHWNCHGWIILWYTVYHFPDNSMSLIFPDIMMLHSHLGPHLSWIRHARSDSRELSCNWARAQNTSWAAGIHCRRGWPVQKMDSTLW